MPHKAKKIFVALMLACLCSACKSGGIRESLDEQTLVSVIAAEPALVFFRHSLSGEYSRDFVSMGPAELVGSNRRDYYLWLSFWGTLPDGSYRQMQQPEQLVVVTGNQRIELERTTTDYSEIDVSQPVYEAPVPGADAGYFRVSADTLLAIGSESLLLIEVGEDRFELWGDQSTALASFEQFVEESVAN